MKALKVLGGGPKCKPLEQRPPALKAEHNLDCELINVTAVDEIILHRMMMTPGLVITDKTVRVGLVPNDAQLLQWLKEPSQ